MATKKLSKSGTVTIPRELRAKLGIVPGSAVNIDTDGEFVIIGKHVPLCRFCGSAEKVVNALGIEICVDCARKIQKKAELQNG